jgi:ankyrin
MGCCESLLCPLSESTELIEAAKQGDVALMASLLDQSANKRGKHGRPYIDETDIEGTSALSHCAYNGHLEAMKLLIDRGALDTRIQYNYEWRTPLHSSAYNGHVSVTQLLIAKGGCKGGKMGAVFHKGTQVDPTDKNGATPLHLSAQNGHLDVSRLLITNGARVDAADNDGVQPLHLSIDKGHIDVARLLVDNGARFDAKTNSGLTPLQISNQERLYVGTEAHNACIEFMVDEMDKAEAQAAKDEPVVA